MSFTRSWNVDASHSTFNEVRGKQTNTKVEDSDRAAQPLADASGWPEGPSRLQHTSYPRIELSNFFSDDLPPTLPQNSGQSVYQNLSSFLMEADGNSSSRNRRNRHMLREKLDYMNGLDLLSSLVHSHQYRMDLLQISSELRLSNHPALRQALQQDETDIFNLLRRIISSDTEKAAVLRLRTEDAKSFLNLLHAALDKGWFRKDDFGRARRLLVKLSEVSNSLPAALSIKGVVLLDPEYKFYGGFADIFLGSYQGRDVAVKRMRAFQTGSESDKISKVIYREALVWQCLKHPNVLPFLGIDSETFPRHFCMVSPWMRHGTVLQYRAENGIVHCDRHISEVVQGLHYLHSQNVVHGDLRGANILIDEDWHAVLADFGLVVFADATAPTSNHAGSRKWMAPELHNPELFGLNKSLRTFATDIYAFACTCLEIYTGNPPFATATEYAAMHRVMQGQRPERPYNDAGEMLISDNLWDVMERCWSEKPSDRMGMREIFKCMGIIETGSL